MDERKLIPTLNRPFDVIYSCNKSGNWLPLVDMFMSGKIEFGFSTSNLQTVCTSVFANKSSR